MIDPLELLQQIAEEKTKPNKWDNQPFRVIKLMSNTEKGDLAVLFFDEYSQEMGFSVEDVGNRLGDYDAKVNGMRFEVKMATEDIKGSFQFNHIRLDYKYDWLLCLGVAPNDILFDIWSKADVATGRAGTLVTMGRGQNASWKLTKAKKVLHPIADLKDRIESLSK